MEKPRIIIADEDYGYLIPLQLKFIEEFFEKIDLEVITDRNYFEQLFLVPQRVDILIVSEELYNSSLNRHNVNRIFVLTERSDEGQTTELAINRISKYTSLKEIFNEIIGQSAEIFSIETVGKKETQVVLVSSACGGTGKTTVAMGISACLTKSYKKVLYINAESFHSFQYLLENQSPISATEVYAALNRADKGIYDQIKHVIRKEEFSYLPPFKAALVSVGVSESVYREIIESAKNSNEYDYIIVDSDSTLDENKTRLMDIANKVVIVTNQAKKAVFATNMLVANINGVNTDKYVFVCNNFSEEETNALILSENALKFTVNDYVQHMNFYEQLKCGDFAKDSGIQKVAFLVM